MKANFVNVCTVEIGGKQPGEVFPLDCDDTGTTPAALYWRKRVNEGSVVQASPQKTAEPVASEAKATIKKGK